MNVSRKQLLIQRLLDLQSSAPEIQGAAVVSNDGLSIAAMLSPGIEEDRVAAMSAAMLSLGERIARELDRGSLQQVYIKGVDGYALLTAVGKGAVLTIIADGEARLGMLLLELRGVVEDIADIL